MIRPILKYGDSGLHTAAAPVERFDESLHRLLDDMAETMYSVPGIGLAAPQIGVPLRVFVIDLSVGKRAGDLIELVNPAFVACEGLQLEEEGCLSLPGFNATVVRPSRAVVRGLDRHGDEKVVEGTGLLARALQHEMDHLDGTLYVDRLRGIKRDVIVRKVQKLKRAGRW
ncbi:MAG TPA: peptide deformylase [Vicinamibacterales bacterium]|nr:peptide deformylase [Vicinamibacterales bacterium]